LHRSAENRQFLKLARYMQNIPIVLELSRPSLLRHGGSGNRQSRKSLFLSAHEVRQLLEAAGKATGASDVNDAAKALKIGPLNRHTTIHWPALGIPSRKARAALAFLQKRMADFLNRRGYKFAWVLTWENPIGKGLHTHMLWHLPAERDVLTAYLQQWRRWRGEIAAKFRQSGEGDPSDSTRPAKRMGRAIMTKRIGGSARAYLTNPALHRHALRRVLAYICKGAKQETLDAFGLDRAHEQSGEIIGRRASWWQSHCRHSQQ
jgi:hypothetical protein